MVRVWVIIPLPPMPCCLNLLLLISCALDGIAYYAEAESDRAYGQKTGGAITGSRDLSLELVGHYCVRVLRCIQSFGSNIIALLTSINEVRATAQTYLIWLIFLPLWSF